MDKLGEKLEGFLETLEHYKAQVSKKNNEVGERVDPPVNALADIAAVNHAHTVKIGLAFKPPISVDAAVKALEEAANLVPNFAAAYLGMEDAKDSRIMRGECRMRLLHLFTEQESLVKQLQVESQRKTTAEDKTDEATLACVNKVLNQCNKLQELKVLGASGVAGEKLDSYQAMYKDAASELREWIDNPDDDDDFGFGDEEEQNTEPQERSEEHVKLAENWHDKLVKLQYLVKAVRNRRLKFLQVEKLDQVVDQVDKLGASIDDVVGCFQLNDFDSINGQQIKDNASRLLDLAHVEMDQEDQYIRWVNLFKQNFF